MMMISQRSSIIGIMVLLMISCTNDKKYEATETCSNLRFHAHTIFPGENIIIKFNKEVILNETINNMQEGYYFDKNFYLPNTKDCIISINTSLKSKRYIDTSFVVNRINNIYHLIISMPHPINWEEFYQDSVPPKEWGYLPIDSCIRFVKLIPDSLYINTLEI
jgi:hypothetical protein